MMFIIVLAIVGFGISLYTYILEHKLKNNPTFKASCDLSDRFSCSKPILSPYGKLFMVSNALVGMLYYALTMILAIAHAYTMLLIAALGACGVSLVLAYILYTKIKTICILCTSLYIINFLILLSAIHMLMQTC